MELFVSFFLLDEGQLASGMAGCPSHTSHWWQPAGAESIDDHHLKVLRKERNELNRDQLTRGHQSACRTAKSSLTWLFIHCRAMYKWESAATREPRAPYMSSFLNMVIQKGEKKINGRPINGHIQSWTQERQGEKIIGLKAYSKSRGVCWNKTFWKRYRPASL